MASTAVSPATAVLIIDNCAGGTKRVYLEDDRYRLGRSHENELSFPEDHKLSRAHLVFECATPGWMIRDLDSRNGTRVNGKYVSKTVRLMNGDRIAAGQLSITFFSNSRYIHDRAEPVVIVDDPKDHFSPVPPVSITLQSALESRTEITSNEAAHVRALVHAGRELVSNRSLEDLFQIILELTVDAVNASRGVLMTREDGELVLRAHHGEGCRISTTVVNRVLEEKASLLIVDALLDQNLKLHDSIRGQVRSILAVPLQTDDRVIGVIYVDSALKVRKFTPEDLNLLTVMANIAAIRIENARLLEIERTQALMAHDLHQAAGIQRGLLPSGGLSVSGYDIAGYNAACRTVGGDYYGFLKFSGGQIGIAVGDVAGKGMPAALLMSGLHARVQVMFEEAANLSQQVERLNRSLSVNCPGNRFITFFIASLEPETGQICFCNAGHNPPLLLRSGGEVEALGATGMVLGIAPLQRYEEKCCRMDAGDVLVLFSDGVTEACHPDRDVEFGEERLIAVLRARRNNSAAEMIDAINQEIALHTAGALQSDDITLVIARRVS